MKPNTTFDFVYIVRNLIGGNLIILFISQIGSPMICRLEFLTILKANIQGNEIANELLKDGRHLIYNLPFFPYEHAYFLYKDKWKRNMPRTPYKRSVRHLQKKFIKYTNDTYKHLEELAENFSNRNNRF